MKQITAISLYCLILLFGFSQETKAQNSTGQIFKDIAKDIVSDPTTYVPAGLLYVSSKGDWNTSQPLFMHGYVEANPMFTVNGLPNRQPISFTDGNRKIAMFTFQELGISIFANTGIRLGEHFLISQYPENKRLIHSAGWVARIGFAAFRGYILSHEHFVQWQNNKRMIATLP